VKATISRAQRYGPVYQREHRMESEGTKKRDGENGGARIQGARSWSPHAVVFKTCKKEKEQKGGGGGGKEKKH